MKFKDGRSRELTLLTVPTICEPLVGQPIRVSKRRFPHLAGIELADPDCRTGPLESLHIASRRSRNQHSHRIRPVLDVSDRKG